MNREWLFIFGLSLVAAFLLGAVVSMNVFEHKIHNCSQCFWAKYDELAAKGEVKIRGNWAYTLTRSADSLYHFNGFSRTFEIGKIGPGETKTFDIPLP